MNPADFRETHDVIDNAERYLAEKMGCNAVIHMDPVAVGDKESEELKQKLTEFAHTSLSPRSRCTISGLSRDARIPM